MKIFGVSMVKNGCGRFGDRALKLIVSEEGTKWINWFFACWYRFTKIKSWTKFFGWTWSKKDVASLMFFACRYKFKKVKSWFIAAWSIVAMSFYFISRKLCRFLCFRLALLHSLSYFFSSIDHILHLCPHFLILFPLA